MSQGIHTQVRQSNHNYAIENFRGAAIVFVVLTHLHFASRFENSRLLEFAISNGTTFFVFMAGLLFFLTERNRFSHGPFLAKKLRTVVLPFLIFSTPGILYALNLQQNKLFGLTDLQYSIWAYLTGFNVLRQLWFVPMIFCFYLLAPLFLRVGRAKNNFILVSITATLLIFSLYSDRSLANVNPIYQTFHFAGVFMLGIAFSARYTTILRYKREIAIFGIIAFFGSLMFIPDERPQFFFDSLFLLNMSLINKLGLACALLLGFECFLNRKNMLLGYLAQISFGLFFAHTAVRWVIFKFIDVDVFADSPILYSLLEIGSVFIFSAILIELLRLALKGRSKYVIGC
jgi:peptidoglycan/LPS O-acetylase OafA/YrhL